MTKEDQMEKWSREKLLFKCKQQKKQIQFLLDKLEKCKNS